MSYPYKKNFRNYCKTEKRLTDASIVLTEKSADTFWNYYINSVDNPDINSVTETDLRNFFNSLETQLHFKKNTINKYVSHIKTYFTYLYSHHLIDNYPVVMISGRHWNRQHDVVINWMDKLPEIAQIDGLNPITVKFLLATALGYKPDEILQLRFNTVMRQLNNDILIDYIGNHCDFSHGDNPYLISKKNGGFYASDFNLARAIEPDREILGMQLTLQSLRLSYVYSKLSDKTKTDEDLKQILRINQKSLLYYRKNLLLYVHTHEFKL